MRDNPILEKVVDFHGHLCPGIAYGYRAALAAMERLGKRAEDEEIVAIVENDSCSVDAIQVITGCTFGKGNLIYKDFGKQVYTFFRRSTGEGFRISVVYQREETPEEKAVWEKFLAGDKSPKVAQKVRDIKARKVEEILSAKEERVISVQPVALPLPPKARLYPSIRCDQCGEKTMEARIIRKNGRRLCIPCSEA
jgi:formylmethanofuran dehydrogenase subunit E